VWVLTRSEAGKHKLYTVSPEQRAQVRKWAAAWRRYQRARARLIQHITALIALADQITEAQRVDWPAS
jgi:DNA-binding PadR family transcriptional regulator